MACSLPHTCACMLHPCYEMYMCRSTSTHLHWRNINWHVCRILRAHLGGEHGAILIHALVTHVVHEQSAALSLRNSPEAPVYEVWAQGLPERCAGAVLLVHASAALMYLQQHWGCARWAAWYRGKHGHGCTWWLMPLVVYADASCFSLPLDFSCLFGCKIDTGGQGAAPPIVLSPMAHWPRSWVCRGARCSLSGSSLSWGTTHCLQHGTHTLPSIQHGTHTLLSIQHGTHTLPSIQHGTHTMGAPGRRGRCMCTAWVHLTQLICMAWALQDSGSFAQCMTHVIWCRCTLHNVHGYNSPCLFLCVVCLGKNSECVQHIQ